MYYPLEAVVNVFLEKKYKIVFRKPIIAHSIEAIHSGLFDEVMVSTDDIEIAEIAIQYGAKVFLRNSVTANDHATTFDVIQEVILEYAKRNKDFGLLVVFMLVSGC
jgi:N-acylneuraminate cytidylyltransferase